MDKRHHAPHRQRGDCEHCGGFVVADHAFAAAPGFDARHGTGWHRDTAFLTLSSRHRLAMGLIQAFRHQ
jgi:hypothetical protein